jgi:hypothetical protein
MSLPRTVARARRQRKSPEPATTVTLSGLDAFNYANHRLDVAEFFLTLFGELEDRPEWRPFGGELVDIGRAALGDARRSLAEALRTVRAR